MQLGAYTRFQQQESADSCGWDDMCSQTVAATRPVQGNDRLRRAIAFHMDLQLGMDV